MADLSFNLTQTVCNWIGAINNSLGSIVTVQVIFCEVSNDFDGLIAALNVLFKTCIM